MKPSYVSDNCSFSREGAYRLAATIEEYWRTRGHGNVKAEPFQIAGRWRFEGVERISEGDGPAHRERWGVRSNLVNGLPPHGND